MFYKFFIKLSGILGCLITSVMFLCSCSSKISEQDYYLSQQRDNNLTGIWIYIDPETNKETENLDEYKGTTGELIHLNFAENSRIRKEYYYTKGGIIYILTLGDKKGKVSERTRKLEYKFSEDKQFLYLKEPNSSNTNTMIWKRKK
ncbi:hypothetical protein HQ38_00450 [Porphyromonas crevioricanis]|uniref:Lipocalin-like domain-containing protein n=2 Tax=Porphyromonadaceae TaxID=171551 RepID=A0AB34PK60_9PORP|nr:hypothetical protein JT26_10445 [Porphyromonas sp. COT-108 OH1349]KGN96789.1 hypothetical protein HQ38_00450 [Porphyromonas crevioricanis]